MKHHIGDEKKSVYKMILYVFFIFISNVLMGTENTVFLKPEINLLSNRFLQGMKRRLLQILRL